MQEGGLLAGLGTLSVTELSRFVMRQYRAEPSWASEVGAFALEPLSGELLARLSARFLAAEITDEVLLKAGLRRLRNFWLCLVAERDLAGRADLSEVMLAMSLLADFAIICARDLLYRWLCARHGTPRRQSDGSELQLDVIGMGKLGAFELNASSDVDLIFLYREDGETDAAAGQRGIANEDFFTRLARRLMNVLSEVTADGFVFRVDMRLRPNGDSGALVCSYASLEEYLMVQGRTWERLAWIKARVLGQSDYSRASEMLLKPLIEPFVYRKYLDFSAIAALRDLHDEIRAEAKRRETRYPKRAANVKLGRGGIREIEFIAQHMQLIRGGREPALRTRPTLDVLDLLAAFKLLRGSVVRQLKRTYVLLRDIEHRLQYRDDQQTHVLPDDAEERAALVRMCANFADPPGSIEVLLARLAREQGFVAAQFDLLFRTGTERIAEATPRFWGALMLREESRADVLEAFAEAGFADTEGAYRQLHALWNNPRIRRLPASAQDRLEKLVPAAIALAFKHARVSCDAATLLSRLFALLEAIASRAAYLALLYEYPDAFDHVAMLLAASPWAARFLIAHPLLLDELLQDQDDASSEHADFGESLQRALAQTPGDVERQMDVLRETFNAAVFGLLLRDLNGRISVEELADELAAWCDQVIAQALHWAWFSIAGAHAGSPDLAVIAYGKLGGRELAYASDLDLVFITGTPAASEQYRQVVRLSQRLISWLTAHTPAGALFDVDVRLRPDGEKGLAVATLDGFERYQQEDAWVWEHQALTRARYCAGDATLGRGFEEVRRSILCKPRELTELRSEIVKMRQRMIDAHPNHSGEFDLKHDRGGMVDIEFAVQFLILAYGREVPGLLDNVGNIALLQRAAGAALISAELAHLVANAYRDYRFTQHRLRLAEARFARVAASEFAAERAAVERLYGQLLT
jgi:glutamate-ammonia-ligase adenylyltransferase